MSKRSLLIASTLVIVAVLYLILSGTSSTASFFVTIEELRAMDDEARDRALTVSGAVIGESIAYDANEPRLTFTIAHVPGDLDVVEAQGGLPAVLHRAVSSAATPRLDVVYDGVRPDLLVNEAQAIIRGRLGPDSIFYADELLLKCPSRYAEEIPEQIEGAP